MPIVIGVHSSRKHFGGVSGDGKGGPIICITAIIVVNAIINV